MTLSIVNGIITTTKSCTIVTPTGTVVGEGTIPGLHFGLIDYNCGGETGSLLSRIDCKSCGVYCSYNDFFEKCKERNFASKTIIGVLFGILIGIIITKLYKKVIRPKLISLWDAMVIRYYLRQDRIIKNRTSRYGGQKPRYKEIRYGSVHARNIIEKSRVNTAVVVAVAASLIYPVLTCDQTLYMTSQGKICNQPNCFDTSVLDFQLKTGSTICFRSTHGTNLTVTFDSIKSKQLYYPIYKTSDYEVKIVQQLHRCKGTDCWDEADCRLDTQFKTFDRSASQVQGFGCTLNTLNDGMCFHTTSCLFYHWELVPAGPIGTVYEYVSDTWEIQMTMTHNNVVTKNVFTTNQPTLNMDMGGSRLPIVAYPLAVENVKYSKHILSYNGEMYDVEASALNLPVLGMVGDLQIDIVNNTQTFVDWGVKCSGQSGMTVCWVAPSSLQKISKVTKPRRNLIGYHTYHGTALSQMQTKGGLVAVRLGNFNVDALFVTTADCKYSVKMAYSCIGCSQQPYLVLEAYDIKSYGMIKVESDCGFTENYLSCNTGFIVRYAALGVSNCSIHGPNNMSLEITFEQEFTGALHYLPMSRISGTFMDEASSMVSSTEFITSMFSSIAFTSIIIAVAGMLSNIIKSVAITRAANKAAETSKV